MTKKVKSKVLEIMALALEFNGRSTKCECTGSKPTIFVNFSGHTCELDVNIYTQGWTFHNTNAREIRDIIYLDRTSTLKELNKTLKTLKAVIAEYEERENRRNSRTVPAVQKDI